MSKPPSAAAKIELETVVNWPLLVSAASVALLLLAVPLVLACIAALRGQPAKDPLAARPAAPWPQPVKTAPTPTSPRPAVQIPAPHERTAKAGPRQVYVKAVLPPIPADPTPIPKTIKTPRQPPPALNPILQVRQTKTPRFKRIDEMTESALLYQLAKTAKDVDLESVKGTCKQLQTEAGKDKDGKKPPILALCAKRPDLQGLPLRQGAECQARPEDAKKMQEISLKLRRETARIGRAKRGSPSQSFQRADHLREIIRTSEHWFRNDGISTLVQMLEIEDTETRFDLLKRLKAVKSAKASGLLARQALFDLSCQVRAEAVEALKDRSRAEYRQVLLDGLRYPWPPVAAHAAEALAALKDDGAVLPLVRMLDEPDPCAPVRDRNNKWTVAEVVRVNHLRNCLLCHAVSTVRTDPLRSVVPVPGEPLPSTYYSRDKGDFVRADITYLRQDLSLIERVAKPDKWPEWQRFDYLVRRRELTKDELAALKKKPPSKAARYFYPQREAVRFALRELTGLDAGESSADWYRALCTPSP